MAKKFDVVSIGSAFDDIFIRSDQIAMEANRHDEGGLALTIPLGAKVDVDMMRHEVGGGGANSSVCIARLGLKSALLARIGNDLPGEHIVKTLEHERVETDKVIIDRSKPTGQSILLLAPNGNRTSLAYRGAARDFHPDDISEHWLAQTEWIYLSAIGGNMAVLHRIFAIAHIHGIKVAWNPGGLELAQGEFALAPLLEQVDLLIMNREEAAKLTNLPKHSVPQVLKKLINLVKQGIVVVTNGGDGAAAFDGQDIITLPAHKVAVVDTTGAGDAFGSGFLAAHIDGQTIDRALSFAMRNSESVIGAVGAQTGLLTQTHLDHFKAVANIKHQEVRLSEIK